MCSTSQRACVDKVSVIAVTTVHAARTVDGTSASGAMMTAGVVAAVEVVEVVAGVVAGDGAEAEAVVEAHVPVVEAAAVACTAAMQQRSGRGVDWPSEPAVGAGVDAWTAAGACAGDGRGVEERTIDGREDLVDPLSWTG